MTTTSIENYVPLPQAAERLKIKPLALQRLIDAGILHAVKLGGVVAVAESELKQTIFREQFDHLRGQAITVPQAAEKYSLRDQTIRDWVTRGYIVVLKEGHGMTIDEADMAYCAAVYEAMGGSRGKRVFDDSGHPYQLKRSDWADYQRERRRKKKTGPLS